MSLEYLRFDVDDLIGYLPRLRDLMVPSDSLRENDGGKPGKISGSPAPWTDQVANIVLRRRADMHLRSFLEVQDKWAERYREVMRDWENDVHDMAEERQQDAWDREQ